MHGGSATPTPPTFIQEPQLTSRIGTKVCSKIFFGDLIRIVLLQSFKGIVSGNISGAVLIVKF